METHKMLKIVCRDEAITWKIHLNVSVVWNITVWRNTDKSKIIKKGMWGITVVSS